MPDVIVASPIDAELAALDSAPIAIVGAELPDTDNAKIDAGLAAFFRTNPDPSRFQVDVLIGSRDDRRVYDRGPVGTYEAMPIIIPEAEVNLSAIEVELTSMNEYLKKLGVEIARMQVEPDIVKLDGDLARFVAANPMPDLFAFNTVHASAPEHLEYYKCVLGIRRMDDELAVMGLKRH